MKTYWRGMNVKFFFQFCSPRLYGNVLPQKFRVQFIGRKNENGKKRKKEIPKIRYDSAAGVKKKNAHELTESRLGDFPK